MVCTYCGKDTRVINSRLQKRTNSIWRRRKCQGCLAVFSTAEHVDYEKSWVVQYISGPDSPFLRDKLLISIYKACQHRQTAMQDAIGLTNTIIGKVSADIHNGRLAVNSLAGTAHRVLARFDTPAAISYQAFHADVL